jgi:hypothetical protein
MNTTLLDRKIQELSDEARPVFENLARAVREASDGDPALHGRANLAVLFAADALSAHPKAIREQRWRRLLRAVEPLARHSHSNELRALVAENRDLLV